MACLPTVDPVSTLAAVTAHTGDTEITPVRFASGAAVTSSTSHAARATRGTPVATGPTVTASPQTGSTICWATVAAVAAEPAGPGDTVETASRTTITAGPTVSSNTSGQQRGQQDWNEELPPAAHTAGPTVTASSGDAIGAGRRTSGAAVATVATDPDRPITPRATGAAVTAGLTIGPSATVTAVTTVTDEVPAGATGPTVGASPAITTGATIAKQPSHTTITAGHPGLVATPAGTAVTEQPATATPSRIGHRTDITVADQATVAADGKHRVDQVVELRAERTGDPLLAETVQRRIDQANEPPGADEPGQRINTCAAHAGYGRVEEFRGGVIGCRRGEPKGRIKQIVNAEIRVSYRRDRHQQCHRRRTDPDQPTTPASPNQRQPLATEVTLTAVLPVRTCARDPNCRFE